MFWTDESVLIMLECEKNDHVQIKYFHLVLTLFLGTWVVSNIAAIKIVSFFGITLTGGFLIFPFTSATINLIVEVYGYKLSRQAIWCGLLLNLIYLFFINIINIIPSAPDWPLQTQFQEILVPQNRIFIASLIAFWLSGFSSSYIMAKLKYKGISLIQRIILSSILFITIDITLFFLIAFVGTTPLSLLKKIFFFAFIKKFLCEIVILPLIWLVINKFKELERYEILDDQTDFNPFSMDNVYHLDDYRRAIKQPSCEPTFS